MARQVAHDIKNPLTPIQLSAEHAQRVNIDRGRPLSPVLDDCIASILSQVRLLRQIAAEFSSFASSATPRPTPTRARRSRRRGHRPVSRRPGRAHRDRDVSGRRTCRPSNVDRTLLARAITNVIENALHAMPGAGSLTIRASWRFTAGIVSNQAGTASGDKTRSPAPSPVTASPSRFADTGIGMDAESMGEIFEPYFSTKAAGTGLGLTIAKRNVELNGGTIEVSQPERRRHHGDDDLAADEDGLGRFSFEDARSPLLGPALRTDAPKVFA